MTDSFTRSELETKSNHYGVILQILRFWQPSCPFAVLLTNCNSWIVHSRFVATHDCAILD